jgi:glycosyltransferase involved in cell wall biosynthesis
MRALSNQQALIALVKGNHEICIMKKGVPIKISAVIISFNEEANIARCIDSVVNLVEEVVVVDCFSQDNTKAICLERGVTFYENEFLGFANQKNFAAQLAKYEYILSLDADEYLSKELTASLKDVKSNCTCDGYTMNRLSSYAGQWIKTAGWYPDTKLRLWKRDKGLWKGEGIHERVELEVGSKVKHLRGDLLHHAYDNITQFLEKIQRYSDIYAQEHRYKIHSSALKVFYKTVFAFIKSFLIKGGILDGYQGLLISVCNANFVFYKYSKLLEANRNLKTSLIISTYNREDALELTLLSVLNQSVMPDEIIIADDGSGAETKELIDRYVEKFPVPLIHCWHEDAGFRLAAIRNKAMTMAKNEYLIQIDGDMILHHHFIRTQKKFAWKGRFIQGSRVLLMNGPTNEALKSKKLTFGVFQSGIRNRFNAIYSEFLATIFSRRVNDIYRVRGCNLAFWKEDVLQVNGFNEDFEGWGREDSEFVVRMNNNNIERKHLKFAGFGYHLYHRENSRELLPKNQKILQDAIDRKVVRCRNGIDKYMPPDQNDELRIMYPLEIVS